MLDLTGSIRRFNRAGITILHRPLDLRGRFHLMLGGVEVWDIIFRWGMGCEGFIFWRGRGEEVLTWLANGMLSSMSTQLA